MAPHPRRHPEIEAARRLTYFACDIKDKGKAVTLEEYDVKGGRV